MSARFLLVISFLAVFAAGVPGSYALDTDALDLFSHAAREDTEEAYRSFLEHYSEGKLAEQALKRIEELDYADAVLTNKINIYREFLNKHPDGGYASEIRRRVSILEMEEIVSSEQGSIIVGDGASPHEIRTPEVLILNNTGVPVKVYCAGSDELYEFTLKAEEKTTVPVHSLTTLVFKNETRIFKPASHIFDVRDNINRLDLRLEPEGTYLKKLRIVESGPPTE